MNEQNECHCEQVCLADDCAECAPLVWAFQQERERFQKWGTGAMPQQQAITPQQSIAQKTLQTKLRFAELFVHVCRRRGMQAKIAPHEDEKDRRSGYVVAISYNGQKIASILVMSGTTEVLIDLAWRIAVGQDSLRILSQIDMLASALTASGRNTS